MLGSSKKAGEHRAQPTDHYSFNGRTPGEAMANEHRKVTGRVSGDAGSHRTGKSNRRG